MFGKFFRKKKEKKVFKQNNINYIQLPNTNRDAMQNFFAAEIGARDFVFLSIVVLVFIILIARLSYLQFFNYEKYAALSEQNRYKNIRIEPERGNIYDINGNLIATNGMGYRLIYKKERDTSPENIEHIHKLTGFDKELIEKRIRYGEISPYIKENVIFEDLDESIAHKLMEKVEDDELIAVQVYSKRRYLYDDVASHTIGYVKKISDKEYERLKDKNYSPRDNIGKIGIEKKYDEILRGTAGYKYIEVNAQNKIQSTNILQDVSPVPGKDLILGIDIELQKYMENEFKNGNNSGAFIALNPKDGLIKTIVSYPTYSLNTFSSQISSELWNAILNDPKKTLTNKTIAGEYPPGSVFKVVSSMAFLENGVDPKQKYLDNTGYYQIGKWRWRAWKAGGHGYVDMKKSLVESANPYYYRLADQIGSEAIAKAARDFKLGSISGIDVPGEKKGIIPNAEWKKKHIGTSWYKGDTIIMSIGQGYTLVTPMQIANLYTLIANKGYAHEPHVVRYIADKTEKNKQELKTPIYEVHGYKKEFYDIIIDALKATVDQDNGTTKILRNKNVSVAAKSGSAQNSFSKVTHAWVAGFFPVENPEIVFVCLLENAGSGGAVAGSMAKKFIDKYLELEHGILSENYADNNKDINNR